MCFRFTTCISKYLPLYSAALCVCDLQAGTRSVGRLLTRWSDVLKRLVGKKLMKSAGDRTPDDDYEISELGVLILPLIFSVFHKNIIIVY